MNFWNNPENDSLKIILFVIAIALAGFFVFKYMQSGSVGNTGRVINTENGAPLQNNQPTPSVPIISILPATEIGGTSARLNATVPAMDQSNSATLLFVYGLTTKYGLSATPFPVDGKASASIIGLTCNKIYHYRLIAKNAVGESGSADMTFRTAPSCR